MKKTFFIRTLCLLFALSFFIPTCMIRANAADMPDTSGVGYVFMKNTDQNKLIVKKDNGRSISPASSVKILTGLVAIEALSDRMDERIEIQRSMVEGSQGSCMYLDSGESVSVRDLLYAAICAGYNDAAYALACVVSGSVQGFVRTLNERAQELGAHNTYITNPTGYDDPAMRSTLDDIVIIAREAMKDELYMEISSTVSRKINIEGRGEFLLHNRNALIGEGFAQGYVNGSARGIIAGVTDTGYCVITAPVIDGDEYLCVVMQGKEEDGKILSYTVANRLIDYARHNFESVLVMPAGKLICTIPVEFALDAQTGENGESVANVRSAEDAHAFLPVERDAMKITARHYLYYDSLTAPVHSGTVVGALDIYADGALVCTVPLVVNADLEANGLLVAFESFKQIILSRAAILSLIFAVLLLFLYFFFFEWKSEKKEKKRALHISLEKKKKAQSDREGKKTNKNKEGHR